MQNEEEILSQAEALASRGQWKEAASLLRQHQQADNLSVGALDKLAYYCSRAGDYDGAIVVYQDFRRKQPSEAKWLNALGFQYQQKKQWPDAISAYEQCVELAPRWLLPALRLGDACQGAGELDKALQAYRKGIASYQELPVNRRTELAPFFAKLCAKVARVLLSKPNQTAAEFEEAVKLLQESVAADPNDADSWYRLGCAFLKASRADEALDSLQKAEALAPKKEYVCHKIAQAHLRKGNWEQALKAYERVPHHRRTPYILHGIGQCYMAKGEAMEAARRFYQAIQREPRKFYHYWNFALALISLGAKDQAVEAFESANRLFREEYGKDYRRALAKLEEVRSNLPHGKRISFSDVSSPGVPVISFGTIAKYDSNRGFGFIRDDADGVSVFFHISSVKGRVVPQIGTRARYVREVGEKGLRAAKVWPTADSATKPHRGEPPGHQQAVPAGQTPQQGGPGGIR